MEGVTMQEIFYTDPIAGSESTMIITKQSKLLTPEQRELLQRPIRVELYTALDGARPRCVAHNGIPVPQGEGTTRIVAARQFVDNVFAQWNDFERRPKNYNGRPVGLDASQMRAYESLAEHLRYS